MIDRQLLQHYTGVFGHTFTVAYWKDRPGERVNGMMWAALFTGAPPVTDERIADALDLAGEPGRTARP